MRAGRSAIALTIGLLTMMPAPGARAEEPRQRFLSAPYDDAGAGGTCFDLAGLTGSCGVDASADATTGAIALDLRYTSPEDGDLPGLGIGDARGTITQTDEVPSAVGALLYEATLDITEVLIQPGVLGGLTSAVAAIHASHLACDACATIAEYPLAAGGASSVPLRAVMVNQDGGPVPAGTVLVEVWVHLEAIDIVLGSARAAFTGAVSRIEAAAPSLERVVSVPYLDATAARSCGGSIGTTYLCRAAASADTGRVEFDLGVISPVAGTAPGSGNAVGLVDAVVASTPVGDARGVAYELVLDIAQADAFAHNSTPAGAASASVAAATSLAGACSCDLTHGIQVVESDARVFRLDERLPFVMWTTDPSAAEQLTLTLDAAAGVSNASGTALSTLRAAVSEVRIFEIE